MESKRPYDALIIGAGIGGLSAGIILSLLGFRVAVIEKNPLPGGMMRGYRRGGMDCPVGVHYFGSFGEGEPLRRVCDFLGVTERMSVERMGQDGPIDRYLFDDFTFDLPEGVDAFAASLGRAFPDEGQAIARIAGNLRATLDVQNSFAFFSPAPPLLDSKLYAPLGAYLAGMNCSAGLRNVLGVAARWMGMSDSDCPVFYHHFALASYLLSSWRLKGSGAELAEAFVSRFEELGGTLICGDAVTAILPPGAGAAVGGVRLASGRVLDGSRLVAAIHPKKVIGMLPEGAVKPRHARLVGQLAETEGLFALNAAVDAAAHPALPYNLFRLHADREGTVKDGAFYQLRDGREGKNLLVIITKSPYPEWSRWEDTRSGSRGAAYAEAKADRAGRLLRDAEGIFGPLAGAKILDAYTPLSLRDWVGSPDGSPYGIMRSIHQLPAVAVLSRLAPAGLFFAGQSALSPGILGTLLGSLQVARQVLGPDRFASEVFERLTRGRQERGPDMNDTKTGDELRTAVSSGRIRLRDFAVTVVLWAYYIMGFILFFSPFYLCALVSSAPREEAFQRLNHRLHRSFFTLLRTLTPRTKWRIADEVRDIRSSVIIANHLSFLDPILFVSLFEKQKTIAKNDYFHLPVFGWILRTSGYIPSQAGGQFAADMVDQVKKMREYLQGGGNLFIFPEGHRSRDGRIGTFDQGAFKIARLCRAASIKVVLIRNTGRLFPPGGFLFDTRDETVIDVELAGSLEPDYESEAFSLAALMAEARRLMEKRMCEGQPRLSAGSDPSAGAASRKVALDLDENNDYNPPVNGSSEYPLR